MEDASPSWFASLFGVDCAVTLLVTNVPVTWAPYVRAAGWAPPWKAIASY